MFLFLEDFPSFNLLATKMAFFHFVVLSALFGSVVCPLEKPSPLYTPPRGVFSSSAESSPSPSVENTSYPVYANSGPIFDSFTEWIVRIMLSTFYQLYSLAIRIRCIA